MPPIGDEHEAVALVVPAEDLLEQVVEPNVGEADGRIRREARVGQPDPEVDVERRHQRVGAALRQPAHRRRERRPRRGHPRRHRPLAPQVTGQTREVALRRRHDLAHAHLVPADRERVGRHTAGRDAVALLSAAHHELGTAVGEIEPADLTRRLVGREQVALAVASHAEAVGQPPAVEPVDRELRRARRRGRRRANAAITRNHVLLAWNCPAPTAASVATLPPQTTAARRSSKPPSCGNRARTRSTIGLPAEPVHHADRAEDRPAADDGRAATAWCRRASSSRRTPSPSG